MKRLKVWWWLLILVLVTAMPLNGIAVEWTGSNWNVNLNGALRVSYNDDDIGTTGRANSTPEKKSNKYMSGNKSHVQLSGSRVLQMGIKGIFKTEWGLDPTDTGDGTSFKDMDQYLGLEGGFGMLRAGTMLTPYMQTGIMLDPYRRDSLAARFFPEIQSGLHSKTGKGRGRSTNTLRFDSPTSSQGLSIQIYSGLDETPDSDYSYGTGLSFDSEYLSLFVQWYDNGERGKDQAYKWGGEIKSAGFSVFGQYEVDEGLISLADNLSPLSDPSSANITAEGNDTEGADTWHTGLKYKNERLLLIGQYGERKDSKNGAAQEDGLTGWLVGLSIYLDPTFYIYTGYAQKDYNDGSDGDSRFTIGGTLTF